MIAYFNLREVDFLVFSYAKQASLPFSALHAIQLSFFNRATSAFTWHFSSFSLIR